MVTTAKRRRPEDPHDRRGRGHGIYPSKVESLGSFRTTDYGGMTPPVGQQAGSTTILKEETQMFRTLRSTLIVALAMLFVASAVALAAEGTVSGTVQNVDPQQGRITLNSGEDKTVELRAPAELLVGLQTGDAVEVKISGQKATFIRKQEGVQRPDLGGALQLQPPAEMPKSQ